MAKHLFLEGPIQSGKSTLIKNCLREFEGTLGGFSCKRYRDDGGNVCAFGLVSPTDFDVDDIYDPETKDPGIFLTKGDHGMQANTDAFIRTASALLDASKNADLILMDEIGGVELMSDAFLGKLDEVLSGSIPCIGVLKQQTHAKVMQKQHGQKRNSDITEANERLHKDIAEKYDGIIVPFERDSIKETEDRIRSFLDSVST